MRSLGGLSRSLFTLARRQRPQLAHARIPRTRPPVLPNLRRHVSSETERPQAAELSEHDLKYGFFDVILPEEPFVWGTSHIIPRGVPPQIPRPPYVPDPSRPDVVWEERTSKAKRKLITDEEDLQKLRRAAKLAAETLQFAELLAQPGNPTDFVDMGVHEFILERGAYPSPLLYKGFPKSCCTSVNNILVHGIPDDRPLQDGDIVNVDVTVYLDGFHGDTSRTFLIGDVDEKGRELVNVTEAALEAGIAACGPGRPFRDIGKAIHELLRGKDYSVSSAFTGHGIGQDFHRQPWIHHVREWDELESYLGGAVLTIYNAIRGAVNDEPEVMQPGDCFTIEPAVVQGDDPSGVTYPDEWTVSTQNCARAAQAEHMVLITETGSEVLTRL